MVCTYSTALCHIHECACIINFLTIVGIGLCSLHKCAFYYGLDTFKCLIRTVCQTLKLKNIGLIKKIPWIHEISNIGTACWHPSRFVLNPRICWPVICSGSCGFLGIVCWFGYQIKSVYTFIFNHRIPIQTCIYSLKCPAWILIVKCCKVWNIAVRKACILHSRDKISIVSAIIVCHLYVCTDSPARKCLAV